MEKIQWFFAVCDKLNYNKCGRHHDSRKELDRYRAGLMHGRNLLLNFNYLPSAAICHLQQFRIIYITKYFEQNQCSDWYCYSRIPFRNCPVPAVNIYLVTLSKSKQLILFIGGHAVMARTRQLKRITPLGSFTSLTVWSVKRNIQFATYSIVCRQHLLLKGPVLLYVTVSCMRVLTGVS